MGTIEITPATATTLLAQASYLGQHPGRLLRYVAATVAGLETSQRWRISAPGVYATAIRPGHVTPASDDASMAKIDVDDETHAFVRFAARVAGLSEGEIVARAVRLFGEYQADLARARDPWTPMAVYAVYGGRRVEGQYLPANRRLTITSEPLAGQTFKSPSGAASAVVAALSPEKGTAQRNGWRFWRLVDGDEALDVLRPTS